MDLDQKVVFNRLAGKTQYPKGDVVGAMGDDERVRHWMSALVHFRLNDAHLGLFQVL